MYTFQEITAKLAEFWHKQGCSVLQPHDVEKGAATFNPHTFFRCLGPEPYHAAYIEPCRRPKDGRYAENPNRLQHYFQYQVILKPSPYNIQDLYLQSLEAIGFDLKNHDIRFVHDDWEQPTIGAWGLGWEVWIDGQECSQFTYFQAVAGIPLKPITGEITYGIERLALYLQKKKSLFDLQWNKTLTYGDIYRQNEIEWSTYNFEISDAAMWFSLFSAYEKEAKRLVEKKLPIPALDFVMKASHAFNMLDARGAISVTERASYIAQIRDIAKQVAECYLESREKMGYPLLQKESCQLTPLAPIPRRDVVNTNKGTPQTFLLEIGTEELPAIFVPIGLDGLERQMKQLFEKERLSYSSLKAVGTPRRLAVIVEGLSPEREASSQDKKGPSMAASFDAEGKPTAAALGFFKQIGATPKTLHEIEKGSLPNIRIEEIKGTKYLFATVHSPSVMTQEILKQALPQLILGLEFPKKMRWADLDIAFARPIRWIVALFGDEVVSFDVGPLHASAFSFGHRQLAPDMFELKQASDYKEMLRERHVIVDCEERKTHIEQQIHDLEKKESVVIGEQGRIIPQVLHLVEKPFLTMTDFDESFLKAPQEVLVSEMCEHQKYFPVMNSEGKLQSRFVITANVPPTSSIQSGNRNVLSARLTDGVFLFEHDLKTPLEGFAEKLKGIVFQSGLGTMHDKALRLQCEVEKVVPFVLGAQVEHAQEAALLAKADLATEVVQEFPELQGVMGRIYAKHQKKHPEVAQAIDEHWMPRGENAPLPASKTGIVLSIAEKLDNLIAFFGLGLKPTSSSDPFALRRQALGLVKIIIRNNLNVALRPLLQQCISYFPESFQKKKTEIVNEIISFLHPRIRSLLLEEGFTKGEIDACLLMRDDDIFDIYTRVKTLHNFSVGHKDFSQIIEVYKRCRGQTTGFEPVTLQEDLLLEPAEKELYTALNNRKSKFLKLLRDHEYEHVLVLLSELQPYLSDLFDKVKILADDPKIRSNRIALLQEVSSLFDLIADFQKIQ